MIKSKLHFPVEDFGYVESEVETQTIEEAIDLYNASKKPKIAPQGGLEGKDWNECLERYLNGEMVSSAEYESMNDQQKWTMQEIKKCFKRIKAHNPENNGTSN